MKKVLVIDDDKTISDILQYALISSNFGVILAYDGEDGISKNKLYKPDIIILDMMLPEMSGIAVCEQLRKVTSAPIIVLSGVTDVNEKIRVLNSGADDYVTKPFDPIEIVARIKANLRRSDRGAVVQIEDNVIFYHNLTLDLNKFTLTIAGENKPVTPKELEMLFLLAKRPNQVFTRMQIIENVWGFDYHGDSRVVDVHIKHLRDKLKGASPQWALKTVHGIGYKFEYSEDMVVSEKKS